MEKLVDLYIRSTALLRHPISPYQFAYSKGRSTEAAIHTVVNSIEKAFQFKQFALGLAVDIVGAFDNTGYVVIRGALDAFGVEIGVVDWIIDMLNARRMTASLGMRSLTVTTTRGCPQGGCLSPLLWTLVIDSLLIELAHPGFTVVGYADDVTVFLCSRLIEPLYERAQIALNIVERWCSSHGLSVNPQKTSTVLFTRKRNIDSLPTLTFLGVPLENSGFMKFLGFVLDRRLNCVANTDQKISTARNVFWQCRHSFGAAWGLKPLVVLWFYQSIVLPIATFCCHVWWHKASKGAIKRKFDKLQRMACLAITSAMRTTPSESMQVLLNLPPLHLYVQAEAMRIMYRLSKLGQLSITLAPEGHSCILKMMFKELPILEATGDLMVPKLCPSHEYVVQIPNRDEWSVEGGAPLSCVSSEWKLCFTDGSVMDMKAGASVFSEFFELSLSFNLGVYATIFQAEIFAIARCAEALLEKNVSEYRICICVDSQAALKALQAPYIRSKSILVCAEALEKLAFFNSVKLIWVPGHQGVPGNEEADRLAKIGADMVNLSPEPLVPLSNCTVKNYRRVWLYNVFGSWFENSAGSLWQTRRIIKEPNPKYTQQLITLNRNELRLMIGVITGHVALNYHLSKFVSDLSPLCGCCSEQVETAIHLLCVCPAHANLRRICFGQGFICPESVKSLKVHSVLGFLRGCGHFPELSGER